MIAHITGKGVAVRREGSRVLYRCLRAGHEEWWDFAKDPRYRRHTKNRRLEIGINLAIFAVSWHSEAKGGGYIECKGCRGGAG
jgi:hypothetical protein